MSQTAEVREEADAPEPVSKTSGLDRFFEITKRGSTVGREIRGGIVTFVTMAYIVILNPLILGGAADVEGHALEAAQIGAATGLTAGVMTILFGVFARLPFAIAAGLGINSFLAVSVVGQVTWQEAMGLVMINGIIIVLLGATGARTAIFKAVPQALKAAITVGIGLFIAFIGFVDSGFVNRTPGGPPVQLGDGGSITSVPTLIFLLGLIVIGILVARRVPGGILIGIVATTIIAIIVQAILKLGPSFKEPGGWHMTIPEIPGSLVTIPDFGLIGQFDLFGSFGRIGALSATMLVFTLVFSNFFDAMGTMTGLAKNAGLAAKDGTFPRLRSAFVVEGLGAVAGGATSTSSNTVYVDSASGIGEGARTGLASLTVGVLFLLSMFLTPLTLVVPIEVGSAALVVVGAMMMAQIREIRFDKFAVALPAFLTIVTMPLTYSIANGIGVGFISWALVNALSGRSRKVHWLMWLVAAGFALYFVRGPIESLLAG
ncbi:AGZA family xanthine/uracil permease-like MFS transporter [Microbacterium resistens]|uniref:AGZA family xanthine/uracil permease-like MFS transporter n=1 Tax=Microbacterium resistens TaxID=156977 RepID=A0ABU1SFL6_9MICO|nr:NCS2 family permease [Microbacterium resistens]MDR6867743.1 AGZA family xanthine/uracil permease-like MFS transporter [Microbacterium resistens]